MDTTTLLIIILIVILLGGGGGTAGDAGIKRRPPPDNGKLSDSKDRVHLAIGAGEHGCLNVGRRHPSHSNSLGAMSRSSSGAVPGQPSMIIRMTLGASAPILRFDLGIYPGLYRRERGQKFSRLHRRNQSRPPVSAARRARSP